MTDNEIEIQVTPTGRIRTIYKDDRVALLEAMKGHWRIKRASNVEWEETEKESGWTVRAAHDHDLAIRLVNEGGRFQQVVRREGILAFFGTREAALDSEVRFFWELLPKDHRAEVTYLTKKQFDEMAEYSCTIPTGTTVGKKWKRREPYRSDNGEVPTWYQGEYVKDSDPKMVGIKWTKIEIVP